MSDDEAREASILSFARSTEGFLTEEEGLLLTRLAARAKASRLGPLVEVGSYRGRSSLYLAAGLCHPGPATVCFCVDHHHGSEEMQEGFPHHDPSVVDPLTKKMDTLKLWRDRVEQAGAEDLLIGVVGDSALVASQWHGPLSLVFIDGGHGEAVEWADYRGFAPLVALGGLLVIHDVFEDESEGGRPPYECYLDATSSGEFEEECELRTGSLRVLVRVRGGRANTAELAAPPASSSSASSTAAVE